MNFSEIAEVGIGSGSSESFPALHRDVGQSQQQCELVRGGELTLGQQPLHV
jgi:hypothetical protein